MGSDAIESLGMSNASATASHGNVRRESRQGVPSRHEAHTVRVQILCARRASARPPARRRGSRWRGTGLLLLLLLLIVLQRKKHSVGDCRKLVGENGAQEISLACSFCCRCSSVRASYRLVLALSRNILCWFAVCQAFIMIRSRYASPCCAVSPVPVRWPRREKPRKQSGKRAPAPSSCAAPPSCGAV